MPRSAALTRTSGLRRRALLPVLFDLIALRRQRARLRDLPDHMLRDIGLTAEEARHEADRPFWDAPSHWRR